MVPNVPLTLQQIYTDSADSSLIYSPGRNVPFSDGTPKELFDILDEGVKRFYARNRLAFDVARGEDSYVSRIGPILKKYDSFRARAFAPVLDPEFDELVRKVVGSMNGVGVRGHFLEGYLNSERITKGVKVDKIDVSLNPELLTTKGRKSEVRVVEGVMVGGLGLVGLFTVGTLAYEAQKQAQEISPLLGLAFPVVLAGAAYVGIRPILDQTMGLQLQALQRGAVDRDKFLSELPRTPSLGEMECLFK